MLHYMLHLYPATRFLKILTKLFFMALEVELYCCRPDSGSLFVEECQVHDENCCAFELVKLVSAIFASKHCATAYNDNRMPSSVIMD
jgi:hypothetical protein